MAADGLPTEDWVEVQNELFRKQFGEYHREFRRDEFKYNPALRNACKVRRAYTANGRHAF